MPITLHTLDGPIELPATFYGSCGVEGCTDCRPLFDADNHEIEGTA